MTITIENINVIKILKEYVIKKKLMHMYNLAIDPIILMEIWIVVEWKNGLRP